MPGWTRFGGCLRVNCRISIPGPLAYKAGSSIAMTAELEFLLSFAQQYGYFVL